MLQRYNIKLTRFLTLNTVIVSASGARDPAVS